MKLKITTNNEQHFYGHGKLMITGEYFVLDGASALAVPTKLGQHLRVTELSSSERILYWVALNSQGEIWLQLTFETENFTCLSTTSPEADALTSIFLTARMLNPTFLMFPKDVAVETKLEFPNDWGLGSSSTLIYTIAQWAKVDAQELLKNTLGGSGYDVACTGSHSPIIYRLQSGTPEVLKTSWKPNYSHQLYFAHLGKKQSSPEGIKYYRQQLTDKTHQINAINRINQELLNCERLEDFEALINEHETLVGASLKMIKVSDTLFADYWGSVKSLGAWGGDFVLLTNSRTKEELMGYLKTKNINIVFNWEELIL
jgi:mevalonate kinase